MYKVMFLDDEVITVRMLESAIDWGRYGVMPCGTASDGEEGLALFREVEPDIVIADIRMPKMNGIEFARALRETGKRVKILLLSAYAEFEYAQSALTYQISDYLLKPLDEDKLEAAIARKPNRLTRFLRSYFLIGFMVPLQTTMLPLFLIMKNLHLINTYQGLIFLHSNGAVFALFLYTGFIRAMPRDLEEAAFVDGASVFRTFWQIVFPLLRPVTATLIIFNTIWIWNDFLLSYLFLPSADKATLTMQVYNGVGQYYTDWSIMMPVLVIAVLPMVIFYVFMQRHIVSGLTTGSLKG